MTLVGGEMECLIDQPFYSCDIDKTGLVEVNSVVDFLKKECNINEPDLVELSNILNTCGGDGFINIVTYRKGLEQWISTIRSRSESTSFLESVNEPDLLNMTNNSIDISECTETTASLDDSVFRHSQDVSELLNDMKFQNRKVCEENTKLQTQLEVQEEMVASLSRELQNKVKDEDQMKRKIESLQDQVNMGHLLIEENESLKKKLDKLQITKRELDTKVTNLEKENALLDQQAWNYENKWQKSTCEMDVLKKDMQELQCSFLEQKDLLNQTENAKSIIEEKDLKERDLQDRLEALLEQNEKLQEEKEDAEIRLAQLQTKLHRFADVSDTEDPPIEVPELVCSTPSQAPSICMELKDMLNEDKHLPSPLCEKKEFSRELLFHGRSALLPAYMSAWDLEFSSGHTPDHSLLQLRSDSPLKPTELDIEKKLASVKKLGKNGLENEIIKLYRVNLDLAEKCHKAELRETELQDAVEKHSQTADQEKEKYAQMEESFNHSVLSRKGDLKDLWRLVHSPEEDEESSESDTSLSPSTEILKLQIKQDIEALREKLHKRETILHSLRKSVPRLPFRHKGRPSNSPLVDALNIEVVQDLDSESFECHTGLSIQTECVDCNQNSQKQSQSLHHKNNNKSVPLLRRNNKIHNSVPHWNVNNCFTDRTNVMEVGSMQNNNIVAVKNKLNNSQCNIKLPHESRDCDLLVGLNRHIEGESDGYKVVSMNNEKVNGEKENGKAPCLRRDSYVNAIQNEACSLDEVEVLGKRRDSFKTAIDHGTTGVMSVDNDTTPENDSLESLDSITWKNNAPKFASTPLPGTLKPAVKSVNFCPKIHVFVKEESMEGSSEISDISNTIDSDDSDKASSNNLSASGPGMDDLSLEKNRMNLEQRSSCKDLPTLPEEDIPCVCCESHAELEELTSQHANRNSSHIEDFSPEIWTLSRTNDTSDSSSCRDSGHSSSLTSPSGNGQVEQNPTAGTCDGDNGDEGQGNIELSRLDATHDIQQDKDKDTESYEIQGVNPTYPSVQTQHLVHVHNSDLEVKPSLSESQNSQDSELKPSHSSELQAKPSSNEVAISPESEIKPLQDILPKTKPSTNEVTLSQDCELKTIPSTNEVVTSQDGELKTIPSTNEVVTSQDGELKTIPSTNEVALSPESDTISSQDNIPKTKPSTNEVATSQHSELKPLQDKELEAKLSMNEVGPQEECESEHESSSLVDVITENLGVEIRITEDVIVSVCDMTHSAEPVQAANESAEKPDKSELDVSKLDKSDLDKSKLDKSELNKSELDKSKLNKSELDKSELDKSELDKSALNKSELNKSDKSSELKATPQPFQLLPYKGDDTTNSLKTPSFDNGLVPLLAISPFPSPPHSPCINFFQGREKMKSPKIGPLPEFAKNEEQNNNETEVTVPEIRMEGPVDNNDSNEPKTNSYLAKIRETNIAKRREQIRPNKMPELSELSERDSVDDSTKLGTITDTPTKSDIIQAPEPNGDILPSIPDEFLQKLGLSSDDLNSDELSEQEIESKFASLSLAFKTDAQTLEKRLEIQERSRDIAEQNVDKELQGLRNAMSKLNKLCTDPQVREVLSKIQNHIDVLEKASARVSSRAEVFGAIQQEKRLSKAVDIMVHHVENIHRVHEKEHSELEEARKLLQDSRSLGPSALDIAGGEMLTRRSASVCPNNIAMGKSLGSLTPATMKAIKLMKPRRRVSEIALPKVLGGSGAPNLHPSPSMDQAFDTRFQRGFVPLRSEYSIDEDEGTVSHPVQNDTADSLSRIYDKDPRTRFQAVVASTTVKSAIANSLRRTSNDRTSLHHTPPPSSTESPQISRNNSTDSGKDSQDKEKRKNLEEEAYKKGYEQGMKASLGQDLASLREQQNRINESLGDIMDNIDNHMEEPKGLREVLHERFQDSFPKVQISSWRIRLTMSCFFVVMAVVSIMLSLFPVNSAEVYSYRNLGYPPL